MSASKLNYLVRFLFLTLRLRELKDLHCIEGKSVSPASQRAKRVTAFKACAYFCSPAVIML